MPVCKISGTLTYPDGKPAVGTYVEARKSNFPPAGRITNRPIRVRCNQQGVFDLPLEQAESFKLTIIELGIEVTITVPSSATATLDSLVPS
mgnify:CR=1 FL=1